MYGDRKIDVAYFRIEVSSVSLIELVVKVHLRAFRRLGERNLE
ncbi:MAG: hypothetical protein ACI8UO_006686 [Verrucomicrobiales bacterium]|jgi:hypothetical protein